MAEKKYIECEAAMAAACKALCHPGVLCPDFNCAEVRDTFNAIPAADVRPTVRGKWVDEPIKGIRYHCSVCQGRFDYTWHFCPNCGADMRGNNG